MDFRGYTVCPACGGELEYLTLTVDPPIHVRRCKSCGWEHREGETMRFRVAQDTASSIVEMGWQCPVCRRVYSPTTAMCMYCGNTSDTITATWTATHSGIDAITAGMPKKGNEGQ